MESIRVEEFVKTQITSKRGSGYGFGSGSGKGYSYNCDFGAGDGSGFGFVFGFGDGNGYGSGYGYSYGSGFGFVFGFGTGFGSGSGSGSGYCSDYGDGSGYGCDIKSINGQRVHYIDGVATVITSLHNNIAKGYILNNNLSTTPCYVAKQNNIFAHGETIKKAMDELQNKLFNKMPIEERIEKFLKQFSVGKRYPVSEFYNWHNRLTGSCEMGRQAFAKEHEIDIENNTMTVEEFIDLTKNAYGGVVVRELEQRIQEL